MQLQMQAGHVAMLLRGGIPVQTMVQKKISGARVARGVTSDARSRGERTVAKMYVRDGQ